MLMKEVRPDIFLFCERQEMMKIADFRFATVDLGFRIYFRDQTSEIRNQRSSSFHILRFSFPIPLGQTAGDQFCRCTYCDRECEEWSKIMRGRHARDK